MEMLLVGSVRSDFTSFWILPKIHLLLDPLVLIGGDVY